VAAVEARGRAIRNPVAAELSRRDLLSRAGGLGLAAIVLGALPAVERLAVPPAALAADPNLADATVQAFFDTILPGRPATRTDLGNPIHPQAIAGADPEPGAVEADSFCGNGDLPDPAREPGRGAGSGCPLRAV